MQISNRQIWAILAGGLAVCVVVSYLYVWSNMGSYARHLYTRRVNRNSSIFAVRNSSRENPNGLEPLQPVDPTDFAKNILDHVFAMASAHSPLPNCSSDSPYLIGRLNFDVLSVVEYQPQQPLTSIFPEIEPGGHWKPTDCIPQRKVAIIIAFRDRHLHLNMLQAFLIPILKRQRLEFFFVVSEQNGKTLWNKGQLYNAAFRFAEQTLDFDVVMFHDVDMIPEDDRNSYACPDPPRHVAPFTDELAYQLWYHNLVGGAVCFTGEQFRQINGYSEQYWGWGGEDDDLGNRILANKLKISRPSPLIGRYKMFNHTKRYAEKYGYRHELLRTSWTRWKTDGLTSQNGKILKTETLPMYHHLLVDVGELPDHLKPPTAKPTISQTTGPPENVTIFPPNSTTASKGQRTVD